MTTFRFADNSISTLWRNVIISDPATNRPTHRRMITSSHKCVLVFRATDVLLRKEAIRCQTMTVLGAEPDIASLQPTKYCLADFTAGPAGIHRLRLRGIPV